MINARKIAENRTIAVDDQGAPVLVVLGARPATTSPTRIKCHLAAMVGDKAIPMPFAQATHAEPGKKPRGIAVEFRMELN